MENQWHKTENEVPKDGELVYVYPFHQLCTWNEHYECWDDEEGDDYQYGKEMVEAWFRIPDYKK